MNFQNRGCKYFFYLGQCEEVHIHCRFFSRYAGDTPNLGPVWKLPKEEMYNEKYVPSDEELGRMKKSLRIELEKLL